VVVLAPLLTGAFEHAPLTAVIPFFGIPIFMATFGWAILRRFVWDLVDEVYDGGDYLLIKNDGQEDRVALSNIMNVSASTFLNPPRVTLRLVAASRFGKEIVFCPASGARFNPFAPNAVVDRLIERVHEARANP
jgi:hypothetical protein